MALTSTQIGALAENLVANELMIESNGRLSPFQPIADDDGLDILIYDKKSGKAIPLQIKSRTSTIKKRGSNEPGNTVHFEVRKATLKAERRAYLLCVLLSKNLLKTERAWLLPLSEVPIIASERESKYVIRANKQISSNDKYKQFQCKDIEEVADSLINIFEGST